MNSMVSVAMKDGTWSKVTSDAVDQPDGEPDRERPDDRRPDAGRSKWVGAKAIEKTTATRPRVEPTDRSRSLLTMTKVMPTAITP